MVTNNTVDNYGPTKFLVNAVLGNGAYTTVQSAINACNAQGNGIVWISPGTYTESLTLFPGTHLAGLADTGSVIIRGLHSLTTSGQVQCNNINFQDDGASGGFDILSAAGTAVLRVKDCSINVGTGSAILISNGGSLIFDYNVNMNTAGTCIILTGNATFSANFCSLVTSIVDTDTIRLSGTGSVGLVNTAIQTRATASTGRCITVDTTGQIFSQYSKFTNGNSEPVNLGTLASHWQSSNDTIISSAPSFFWVTGTSPARITYAGPSSPISNIYVDPALAQTVGCNALANTVRAIGTTETIAEGTNGTAGVATLVNGQATVNTTAVQNNTRIELTSQNQNSSTGLGVYTIGAINPGVSFVINSLNAATVATQTGDQSTIYWRLVQPV